MNELIKFYTRGPMKGQDSGHVQLGAYRRKQDNPTRLTTFNRATLKAKLIWSPHSSIDRLI